MYNLCQLKLHFWYGTYNKYKKLTKNISIVYWVETKRYLSIVLYVI